MSKKEQKYPSPWVSMLPIVALIVLLYFTIRLFGSDALGGGSQISLLVSAALCTCMGIVGYGIPWKEFEYAIINNIAGVGSALIVLLIIGSLSAVWMLSGVVPTLIYYGVQIIHPQFFLLSTCLICAAVSVMTGSSWTTIATIGIALMGIGKAQGFADGWVAGAIISGAYFGDKVSPLSDTTILAASTSGTPLFTHIRYMMLTTVPSLCVALVVFLLAGWLHGSGSAAELASFTSALAQRFHITPWLLVVPVVTAVLIARKVPSLVTLFLSAGLAAVFMLAFQPEVVKQIAGEGLSTGEMWMKGAWKALYGSTSLQTGNAELDELVATRGMEGMLATVWLILCAMCLGGTMTASGMLASITRMFAHFTQKLAGMVASTVGCGLFLNLSTADQYISIILTTNMFKEIYRTNRYETRLLSRTTEDAVTVTSVLIPWNTCGMTQATVLNVPTLTYLPYCIFNYVSPLMSILVAALGFRIYRTLQSQPQEPEQEIITQ